MNQRFHILLLVIMCVGAFLPTSLSHHTEASQLEGERCDEIKTMFDESPPIQPLACVPISAHSPGIQLAAFRYDPGTSTAVHSPSRYELLYIQSGELVIFDALRRVDEIAREGTQWYFDLGTSYGMRNDGETPAIVLVLSYFQPPATDGWAPVSFPKVGEATTETWFSEIVSSSGEINPLMFLARTTIEPGERIATDIGAGALGWVVESGSVAFEGSSVEGETGPALLSAGANAVVPGKSSLTIENMGSKPAQLILLGLATTSEGIEPTSSMVEIHRVRCPDDFNGTDVYGTCHDRGINDVTFIITGPNGYHSVADAYVYEDPGPAKARLGPLPPGEYLIEELNPRTSESRYVFCSPDQGNTVVAEVFDQATDLLKLTVSAQSEIVCDWYTIPG